MANPRFSQPQRYQIRKEILDFIADKGYQPGDQFPFRTRIERDPRRQPL
jgi:DNA-binding GntR family transcriptional regulator